MLRFIEYLKCIGALHENKFYMTMQSAFLFLKKCAISINNKKGNMRYII